MLNLATTTTKLTLVTGSATDIEVTHSYVDLSTSTFLPTGVGGDTLTNITTATTTDIVPAPAASTVRNVKHISLFNRHASTSNLCTVNQTDGTDTNCQAEVTLLAGERLVFDECGTWTHYDANGGVYPSTGAAALQSDMEAGTSSSKYVTPQGVNWHPGVAKFWVIFTGNTTTILSSWNVTSITDGTTEATVTIAADFSSPNWPVFATATGTASTAAAARLATARAIAAGTVVVWAVDGAATTALADPSQWCVCGFGDQ
jgi:hypothetical protein